MGIAVSVDYRVIECAGAGQVTLGRSLLKFFGAIIDMNQGTMTFSSTPSCNPIFPKVKKKGKRAKQNDANASIFDNT